MNSLRNLLWFCTLLMPAPAWSQLSEQQQAAIDRIFANWDAPDRPGCALAVIHNGTIVYRNGYGMADLEHDIPIDPGTIFYIGSVSKQFVAMCMLLLEEQGKLDLDEDIRTYLPDFPDYGYLITIRNLIHHTSGIRDNLTLWELTGRSHLDEIPEAQIYDLITRQKQLNFEPGTAYRYSNSCYFMMGLIIERVSGKSLREYADEEIFQKLGMKHTFFGDDNRRIIKHRAFGYGENEDGRIDNMIMRFDLVGSGGLYSNVEDLYLWDQNFYQNRLGARGQALIEGMLTNGRFNDGTEVDYAFALVNGNFRGLRTISHGGALGGYRAFYVRFPDQQFSVIILGNVATLGPETLAYQVASVCLEDQLGPAARSTAPTSTNGTGVAGSQPAEVYIMDEKTLSPYLGRYYAPELDTHYELTADRGKIMVKVAHTTTVPLLAASPTRFQAPSTGWVVEFQKNETGQVTGFLLNADRVTGLQFEKL